MRATIGRFILDENAATAVEYGLIAGLIALVVIVGVNSAFTAISNKFNVASNTLASH
ncbi:Flp family type IVb pilin [Caulobacter sp. S45]|uniref:Flp family type IVb pilin n=1 Tax=Caulobacter sp. S45 TaxID=1641861 RepID=UPI001575B938|nr:Flp family type IVb pilin [Caulobacter sp. S45]